MAITYKLLLASSLALPRLAALSFLRQLLMLLVLESLECVWLLELVSWRFKLVVELLGDDKLRLVICVVSLLANQLFL